MAARTEHDVIRSELRWAVAAIGTVAVIFVAILGAALAALAEAERAVYAGIPAWVTAAFAFAVFGGAGGCLLLLLRSRWAVPVLLLSLAGVIAQMSYVVVISRGYEVRGAAGMVMPALVTAGALFLVWFSRFARRRGWLR